jgi:putative exosortase-associated protein (TIGR04073 family)
LEITLYKRLMPGNLRPDKLNMRRSIFLLAGAVAAVFVAGCAGPSAKLGRGLNNVTELVRGGEIRRSMEQTALWENTETAYTTGFIRGFNASVKRTAVGAFEIVSFPFPSYDPYLLPENPVYPDSYRPKLLADPTFGPDNSLGFSGGDVAPFIPGSRFRIFDY